MLPLILLVSFQWTCNLAQMTPFSGVDLWNAHHCTVLADVLSCPDPIHKALGSKLREDEGVLLMGPGFSWCLTKKQVQGLWTNWINVSTHRKNQVRFPSDNSRENHTRHPHCGYLDSFPSLAPPEVPEITQVQVQMFPDSQWNYILKTHSKL